MSDTENDRAVLQGRVRRLEDRVEELESIIERELDYNLGPAPIEAQSVDCDCGEAFNVTVENGLTCPHCGRGSDDRQTAQECVTECGK